jgi:hypothetical protein
MRLCPALSSAPLLVFLACTACASPSSTPPPATPSSASATAAAGVGPCLATQATRLGAGEDEVATATLHLTPEACTIELRSPAGPITAPACDKAAPKVSMRMAACAAGGDVWIGDPARSDEKTGTIVATIARFRAPDPKADLALICAPFATLREPGSGKALGDMPTLDPSQKARVRYEILADSVGSHEWRLWMHEISDDRADHAAATAKLRDAAKAAGQCQAEWVKTP